MKSVANEKRGRRAAMALQAVFERGLPHSLEMMSLGKFRMGSWFEITVQTSKFYFNSQKNFTTFFF